MFGFIVEKLVSAPEGTAAFRMFGNTGAPAWFGDRLMLFCCSCDRSVVLFADSTAFATARSGTRSKNSPALPRTIVRRPSPGDQASPRRGERLFVSVVMVR